jgi:hypothetical protein
MIAPPLAIERLLGGLGAQSEFRDVLLGDLAEEFASRAETDGVASATRWYRREAMRAAPHLVRSWLRSVRRGDLGHLAGVVATAYTGALVLNITLMATVFGVVTSLGYRVAQLPSSNVIAMTLILSTFSLFAGIFAGVGGYLAAWLDSRAPLVTATTLGLLLFLQPFITRLLLAGPAAHRFPSWYLNAVPVLELTGAIAGGLLCVGARQRAPVA